MNKELFELHTEIKSFIKDKSSSFKLDLPTTLFKRELKAVYRKLVLVRVAELYRVSIYLQQIIME